jgi:ABC-type tungstate transport system substrate-binding protein
LSRSNEKRLISDSWNVRNVGLILFSTLAHRSLALGRNSQDFYRSRAILGTRQTLNTWHTRYPSIIPFMTDYLHRMKTDSVNISRTAQHSPLFPILIIIRSLRYSVEGKQLQDALLPEVLPYLSSPEWQVRIAPGDS